MPTITLEHIAIDRISETDGQSHLRRILSEVDFTVSAGGRLAVIGPSGAGKSSLLRLLNRLDEPAEGRVLFDGVDIQALDPIALRRRVGMVFQQPVLFDGTVDDNLAYPLRLQRQVLPAEQATALLEEFALPAEYLMRRADQLSGGQEQRIAIARALTLDPEVLLLDEPTSALDEESARIALDALLRRNAETGLGLVVVTHASDILRRLDCPVLLVADGAARWFPDADAALVEE